jgi:hypothetical protein
MKKKYGGLCPFGNSLGAATNGNHFKVVAAMVAGAEGEVCFWRYLSLNFGQIQSSESNIPVADLCQLLSTSSCFSCRVHSCSGWLDPIEYVSFHPYTI